MRDRRFRFLVFAAFAALLLLIALATRSSRHPKPDMHKKDLGPSASPAPTLEAKPSQELEPGSIDRQSMEPPVGRVDIQSFPPDANPWLSVLPAPPGKSTDTIKRPDLDPVKKPPAPVTALPSLPPGLSGPGPQTKADPPDPAMDPEKNPPKPIANPASIPGVDGGAKAPSPLPPRPEDDPIRTPPPVKKNPINPSPDFLPHN